MAITPYIPPAGLSLLPNGNLLLHSQAFNSTWSAVSCTITTGAAAAPDGTTTANSLVEASATAQHYIFQSLSKAAAGIIYTASIYVSALGAGSARNMAAQFYDSTPTGCQIVLDPLTGTVAAAASYYGSGAPFSGLQTTWAPVGGGWFRVTFTFLSNTATSLYVLFQTASGANRSYAGDGTSGLLLWGAQLETGAYATPYTATTSAAALGIWAGVNGLPVLPYLPGVMPNMTKAPLFSTKVNRAASGRERRTPFWNYPLWQYEVSYEVIRRTTSLPELFTLWEFFNVAQGMYAPWLMVDPTDNQVLSSAPAPTINTVTGGATADGSTKTFQLCRDINSFQEPVYDVYGQTLLDNGSPAGAYTMGANGVATFSSAPTNGHSITWFGYFYLGCRFLQDDFPVQQITALPQGLWQSKALKWTSLRA